MSNETIKAGELSNKLSEILRDYFDEAEDIVIETVAEQRTKLIRELKETSPQRLGKYKSGWGYTTEKEGSHKIGYITHNKKSPQLTHLLEHGHVLKNSKGEVIGHATAKPHIAKAEAHAVKEVQRKIKERIENIK